MRSDVTECLVHTEQRRVRALLAVDQDSLHELHDERYLLCNPTGAVWDKAEYLARLVSGRLAYRRLEPVSPMDVLGADRLAVLRYRCIIELQIDGTDIPAHECWHMDAYTLEDGQWRCRWSQATGIMDDRFPPFG